MVTSEWSEIIHRAERYIGSLTVRPTSQADAKAGLSDQAIQNGMVVA